MSDYFREQEHVDARIDLLTSLRNSNQEVNGESSSSPGADNREEYQNFLKSVISLCERSLRNI